MTSYKIILIFFLFALITAPLAVLAAGLVPCGLQKDDPKTYYDESAPCNLCFIYVLTQNILDFIMFTIAPIVAVLAVGWGGFNILIAGEKPGQRAEGFKIIQKTVIGLVIMFAGWVLINEALLFFGNTATDSNPKIGSVQATSTIWLPWNKVECGI